MNDVADLAAADGLLKKSTVLREALQFLGQELWPEYGRHNQNALTAQRRRRWTAFVAIWFGTIAINLAIAQLVLSQVSPDLTAVVTVIEAITVILAAVAVIIGFFLHFHHRWLTERQAAERLRSLKFQSLGWHELWCDPPAWRERVKAQVTLLKNITAHDAEHWATADDNVAPQTAKDPDGPVDPRDVAALADYYCVKRLEYQSAYFERQSKTADRNSWATRYHVSAIAVWLSVVAVLLHGLLAISLMSSARPGAADGAGHEAAHRVEVILVGLAALLPVIGFGCRAWSAAFEFPRSRNLF
ncbi:MAG: DUF4231 domain-containing protein, partial [Planctomycetaceae bacterium]|nr:DUF4231 domain-containing protein [Planctomycetaceae bacterium]